MALRTQRVRAGGFALGVVDHSYSSEIAYDFEDIEVDLKNLTNDDETPVEFDTSLKVKQGVR